MSDTVFEHPEKIRQRQNFPAWLGEEWRENRAIYLYLGLFVTFAIALSALRGDDILPMLLVNLDKTARAATMLACAIFAVTAVRVLLKRPAHPTVEIGKALIRIGGQGQVARFVFACLLLALFMATFLYQKTLIPVFRPFDWDRTFIQWDLMLFGGRHPWEVLHPLVGYPAVTMFLDVVYSSWVPMVFVFWAGMLTSERVPAPLRRQYWIATMLAWTVIGIVMATALSSAGPCFLPLLAPDSAMPYHGLNTYLAELNERFALTSSLAKDFLWGAYAGTTAAPGGISAMPSMHNAQAVLFALAAYRVNRRFGHAMAIYGILIFVGSIHLAWHYAVDGIVGAVAAAGVWHLSRLLVSPRTEVRAA